MNGQKYLKYMSARFPNYYSRHYEAHSEDNYRLRKYISRVKLHRMRELEIEGNAKALELLADYLLAEDHLRGLMLRREAVGQVAENEEFPSLGQGARDYLEFSDKVKERHADRTKTCEMCECTFIDWSLRNNARVCSEKCRRRKDALRQRNGGQIKRYRERQQHEYPFYSPHELNVLATRSERAYEDRKIDARSYRDNEEYDGTRLNGRKKPSFTGRSEQDPTPFDYRPRGREKKEAETVFPVVVRHISEVDESDHFVEASQILSKRQETAPNQRFNSEVYAIK